MLKIQVSRLPHREKIARMPNTIVARVVQKLTSYAINCHLATLRYTSSAFFVLSPSILSSKSSA